jgi:hypothetical protein
VLVASCVGRPKARGDCHLTRREPPLAAPAPGCLAALPATPQGPPQVSPPRGRQPGIVDAEARLDPALVRVATPGDATTMATVDNTNRTPSPQMTSVDRRLKRFTERVNKAMQPPLLELPRDDMTHGGRAPPTLPQRRKWIAAQSLTHIPASKRGEHLVLKHIGLTSGMSSQSTSAMMKVYEEIW